MAYTFEKITQIPQADFGSIFNDCYSSIISGKGMYMPTNLSLQERKVYIYEQTLLNLSLPRAITFKIIDESLKVVGFMQGTRENSSIFKTILVLLGKNTSNSKSYLYSTEFISSLKEFLTLEGFFELQLYVLENSRNHTDITSRAYLPAELTVSQSNYTDRTENNYICCAIGLKELDLSSTGNGFLG